MKRLLLLALLAPLVAGCAGRHGGAGAVFGLRLLAAALVVPEPEVVYVPVYVDERPVPPSPPAATATPPRVSFDTGAATDSAHSIDLSSCLDHGVPAGYAHARLTFAADGRVTAVALDKPAGLAQQGVQCLGELLARVSAPPFDGSPATMGVGFAVQRR